MSGCDKGTIKIPWITSKDLDDVVFPDLRTSGGTKKYVRKEKKEERREKREERREREKNNNHNACFCRFLKILEMTAKKMSEVTKGLLSS
jgi:hypothetical protein